MSWWLNNETYIEIVAVYALLAFSIQVCLKAGTFSLASVGFYAISSYMTADLVKHGWPTVPAIAVGIVVCSIIGLALAYLLVRLRDLYLGMATIAFDLMVGVVALNWDKVTGGAAGLYSIPVRVSGLSMTIVVVVVIGLLVLMQRGTIGRTFEAIRDDTQLAVTVGIDRRRYQRLAFVFSAALGALAGSMHSLAFYAISPTDASFSLIITALAMVTVGGSGSWVGALVGAVLLGYLPIKLTSIGDWWPVIYGTAMALVATYLPVGFYGLAQIGVRRARTALQERSSRGGSASQQTSPDRESPPPGVSASSDGTFDMDKVHSA
jgi:branched-chain amino acid transport system permease protein